MAVQVEIISLDSVVLSREKQLALKREIERYAEATDFVIRRILQEHITSAAKTIEAVQEEFAERFDRRPEYLADVVKTARVTIGQHRKMARVLQSARHKRPRFKEGRLILSPPLVRVTERALLLTTQDGSELPIPFDKRSRNKNLDVLSDLAAGRRQHDRVRLTWRREGFVEIDIRVLVDAEEADRS
ncbi:hypothetical protein DRO42_07840 [Candidatus Bathyarchaeota archaeon]|nr:MAG: hypothetical protein DRO42_07840 [Candidatus Bathyarchaeota archaeon]